jgi:hypothetical protein
LRTLASPPDILLVALTTVLIFGIWTGSDGGYAEVLWYPPAILLVVLAVVLAWAAPGRALGNGSTVALASFAAFTGWSFLSIVWAEDRGLALTGANRTLAYLVVFAVVLCRRWNWPQASVYAGIWAATCVVIGAVTFVTTAYGADPQASFTDGRFILPVDYANANAALFSLAAWPLVALAQSRAVPGLVRALSLGTAGVSVELALLAQSKGGALATAATVLLLLVVTRRRLRLLVPLALLAATVALFQGPLFGLFDRLSTRNEAAAATRSALWAMALSFVLLTLVGGACAVVDRRLSRLSEPHARWLNRVAGGAAVAVGVGAVMIAIARFGNPVDVVSHGWHAFRYPARTSAATSHFLTSAGNHRYDFWRVAAHQFESSPLLGSGADNFAIDYLRRRASLEEPLYPHSLEARLLGGTGATGFLLFGIFVVSAGAVCIRAARSRLPGRSVLGVVAVAVLGYWLAHASVDWLWEFPALTAPMFAVVASAIAVDEQSRTRERSHRWRRLRVAAVAVAAAAGAVALVPAWVAARDISLGTHVWRDDTPLAYARLDNAADLNRLSDEPYVIAGTIAERRRDWARARDYFARALDRNGRNWYSHLEAGLADAMSGRTAAALVELRAARRLDPREPIIRAVLNDVRARRPIPVPSLDAAMVERTVVPRGH